MNETAIEKPERVQRPVGRPRLPIGKRCDKLYLFIPIEVIQRFEAVGIEKMGYDFDVLMTKFGKLVIERGLDSLEYGEKPIFTREDGTNPDHAI